MVKILIADDQVLLRESIAYILNNETDMEVVAMAANGAEAVELTKRHKPDVVVMDIQMPIMNGVLATKAIKEDASETKVIILTTFEDPDNIMESFIVNADGYIVKNICHQDLVMTIHCVNAGLTVIHDSVKQIMVERFKGMMEYKTQYQDLLTEKEVHIVRHIASGMSNREIAVALNYSEGTIKNNISRILSKLNMTDRMQVAIFAIENGII